MANQEFTPFTGKLDATPEYEQFTGSLDGDTPKPKGFGSDAVTALKQGVQQLPGMVTGLADIPAGLVGLDRPISRLADRAGAATGFTPGKWAQAQEGNFSQATKDSQAAIDAAWKDPNAGALDVAGAYLTNPRATALNVVQSVPSMAAGGVVGRGLGLISKLSGAARGAIGEGATMAGQSMDQIDPSVDPQRAAAAALATGAGGAAIGYGAGRLAQRMGVADVDTLMAGRNAADAAQTAARPGLVKSIAVDAAQEALAEEAPQSALESAAKNWAEGKDLTEGMARNVVEGAIAGGVMGAGAGAVGHLTPAQKMGIDENAGPLSKAGAIAVNSGATLALPAPTITVDEKGEAKTTEQRNDELQDPGVVETGALGQGRNSETVAPQAEPQPGLPALEYDTSPTGRLIAGEDGVRPETRAEAINATQMQTEQATADAAARQERIDLGQSPYTPVSPIEGAAPAREVPRIGLDTAPTGTLVVGPDGVARPEIRAEAISRDQAAEKVIPNRIQAGKAMRVAGPGHEVVAVDGGFVVRKVQDAISAEKAGAAQPQRAQSAINDVAVESNLGAPDAESQGTGQRIDTNPAAPAVPGAAPAATADAVQPAAGGAAAQADVAEPRDAALTPATRAQEIDAEVSAAATSPENDRPEPTPAQKEAGNYAKGHIKVHGLDISIENPKGSTRSGTRPDGSTWSHDMSDHYGYIKRTVGADKEQVDVYVGPKPDSQKVFVVDQLDQQTGGFDEHKAMLGYDNQMQAMRAYRANFDRGWKVGPVKAMSVDEFKGWLKDGDTTKPATAVSPPAAAPAPVDKEVSRDIGQFKQGLSEFRANQRRNELAKANPGVNYTVEEDDSLKNGYAVVGRQPVAPAKQKAAPAPKPAPVPAPKEAVAAASETENLASKAAIPASEPAKSASSDPKSASEPAFAASSAKIEDFGEKLAGARKDYAALLKEAASVDVAAVPLSKSWPEPDYQKLLDAGADKWTVAFLHAARDAVPTKPTASWKLKRWVTDVGTIRGFAQQLLNGELNRAAVEAAVSEGNMRGVTGNIALYLELGHERSLKGVALTERAYSLYNGQKYSPPKEVWTVEQKAKATAFGNWPRELATGDTSAQAIAAFKAKLASTDLGPKPKGQTQFEIYRRRSTGTDYIIGKKIGREHVDLKKLPDAATARKFLSEHTAELEAALAKYKETPLERRPDNQPRVGDDHRNGAPVSPEAFASTFGFRGVQFGNYVEQGRRQSDLNETYDALMDLAAVLGVPARALSLNGRLGLAFGARGKGGKGAPAAHYEPGNVVINLTKGGGPGSLAHEWWHSLDNYFAKDGGSSGFATDGARIDQLRAEMQAAFREVRDATQVKSLRERSRELDKRKSKPYWNTPLELSARSFETYVIAKLQDQGAANDYLANVVGQEAWDVLDEARAAFFGESGAPSYPYPTTAELPAVRAGFDKFFRAVQTREDDAGKVAMFSRGAEDQPASALRTRTASVDSVRAAVRQLVGGIGALPNGLGRVVVATAADIKADWEPLIGKVDIKSESKGDAQGFYNPGTRTVFLIADHIPAGQELGIAAHELMHKHGQTVLGKAGWDKLHGAIEGWATAKEGSLEREVYEDAAQRVRDSGAELSNQELFPYAVQVALEYGVQPNAMAQQGTVARWLASVRQALRQAWDKLTNKPELFKTMDMVDLAFGIAQMENPVSASVMKSALERQQGNEGPRASAGSEEAQQYSRAASSMGSMTPDQEQAWTKVAGIKTPPTLKERAESFKANLGLRIRQGVFDQFAPIKDVSQEAYMQARLSKGSDGTMEAAMLYGKPVLRNGVPDVDIKDGGFAKVLASLKGEHDRFLWWVAAQRAEKLKAEGKENLFSDKDISSLKTLNTGNMADGTARPMLYAKALQDLNAFNDSVLQMAVDSGLIDKAAQDLFKGQPYVPFYRVMEEGPGGMTGPRFSSGLVNQQAFKKLKGGTNQLNGDLLENMLLNWSHLYSAAARNRAAVATMDSAEQMAVAYKVPDGTKGAIKVMRDGLAEHWAVEDPYLMEAISALHYVPSPLIKPLAAMKQVLTWGVTVNPTFKIRNLIRDSLSAIAQADLSYNPLENVAKGWKASAKDSQAYASMLAGGGVIKFGTGESSERVRNDIKKLGGQLLDDKGWKKLTGAMGSLWEAYNELGDRTENVNRAALYERLVAKGHTPLEANFMARDLMDFSMSGRWDAVRFLAQTVPFLNARLQGLYKLGRAAKEDPRRFGAMAGAVSLASLALLAAYGDDDDWKKREDFDRDSYWWFKIGDTAFRIPKPFEVGAIGTIAERTAELMLSDEMTSKRFSERLSAMVFQTFAMDPVPQAFKPLLDVYSNKDSFTKRAIEGQGDEKLRPQDRVGERTSEIARLVGQWGLPEPLTLLKGEYKELSPKQVDFLLRGYFSWVGSSVAGVTDLVARPMLDRGERPAMRLKDTFMVGSFVESLPSGSSRYVSQLYDQARDVEQAWASYHDAMKRGDTEKAAEIREEEGPKLRSRMAVEHAKRQLAEINKLARQVEANRLMPAETKREKLEQLEHRRDAAARRVAAVL